VCKRFQYVGRHLSWAGVTTLVEWKLPIGSHEQQLVEPCFAGSLTMVFLVYFFATLIANSTLVFTGTKKMSKIGRR
jgi:hypothetical protein